jgi:hypothetical protein
VTSALILLGFPDCETHAFVVAETGRPGLRFARRRRWRNAAVLSARRALTGKGLTLSVTLVSAIRATPRRRDP